MKRCSKCKLDLEEKEFHKDITRSDKLNRTCKECNRKRKLQKYGNLVNSPQYDSIKLCSICKIKKLGIEFHKDSTSLDGLYSVCKICRIVKTKKFYENHSDHIKKRVRIYDKNNSEKVNITKLKRQKERLKTDPKYLLIRRLRNRLYHALRNRNWKKNTKFSQYIGCSPEELKFHIEKQFIQGMTWDNHGEWHIDHKVPLISAQTQEEMYKLCHYTNLQPLWAIDNINKGSTL